MSDFVALLRIQVAGVLFHDVEDQITSRFLINRRRKELDHYVVYEYHLVGDGVKWTVYRRFKECHALYRATRGRFGWPYPKHPRRRVRTVRSPAIIMERAAQLATYMRKCLEHPHVRQCPALLEFLEIGPTTFGTPGPPAVVRVTRKEGYLHKRSGGRRAASVLGRGELLRTWRKRWCCLYESCFAYFEDWSSQRPLGVLIMDRDARVEHGATVGDVAAELVLSVHSRRLHLRGADVRDAADWLHALQSHVGDVDGATSWVERSRVGRSVGTPSGGARAGAGAGAGPGVGAVAGMAGGGDRRDGAAAGRGHTGGAAATQSPYASGENLNRSFAPWRPNCAARWLVDGKATFWAIADAIARAEWEIMIAGWWVCSSLPLVRPERDPQRGRARAWSSLGRGCRSGSSASSSSVAGGADDGEGPRVGAWFTLEDLIRVKAREGCKVYVQMYQEVPLALPSDSETFKQRLLALHPSNVHVLRHPPHGPGGQLYWSHHEKLVIVDRRTAFVGGLDLAFGRFDSPEHPLADPGALLWRGQDYYNPHVRDFRRGGWHKTLVDRETAPRMGWHDVHVQVKGHVVRDVVVHYCQRWNHAVAVKEKTKLPLLVPDVILTASSTGKPDDRAAPPTPTPAEPSTPVISALAVADGVADEGARAEGEERKNACGLAEAASTIDAAGVVIASSMSLRSAGGKQVRLTSAGIRGALPPLPQGVGPWHGSLSVQALRSCSGWSLGAPLEHSIEAAYLMLIEQAQHLIYLENQFFISWAGGEEDAEDEPFLLGESPLPPLAAREATAPKAEAAAGALASACPERRTAQAPPVHLVRAASAPATAEAEAEAWGRTMPRAATAAGRGPVWESPLPSARTASEASASYSTADSPIPRSRSLPSRENGKRRPVLNRLAAALVDRISRAIEAKETLRVVIVLPVLPSFEGTPLNSSAMRLVMYWQYRTICRGPQSMLARLRARHPGVDLSLYISFYALRGLAVCGGKYATEQVYIHSKLAVFDDRHVICGSANINDRSLIGARDSEVCLLLSGGQVLDSLMNNASFKVTAFAHSLRRFLWCEHVGLPLPRLRDAGDGEAEGEGEGVGERAAGDGGAGAGAERAPSVSVAGMVWPDHSMRDPVGGATFFNLWQAAALHNTMAFGTVFPKCPSDAQRTYADVRACMAAQADVHAPGVSLEDSARQATTPVPGGPEAEADGEESKQRDGRMRGVEAARVLASVRGRLTRYPLEFLADEDLKSLELGAKEGLVPSAVFV